MPDITTGKDTQVSSQNQSTWDGSRAASSGTATSSNGGVRRRLRPSGNYDNHRTFIAFDTSSITEAPASATLTLTIATNASEDFYILKAKSGTTGDSGTEFVAADYSKINGFSSRGALQNWKLLG